MVRGASFSGVVGGGFPEELYVSGVWGMSRNLQTAISRAWVGGEKTSQQRELMCQKAQQGLVGNCKYTRAFRVEHAQEWSGAWTSLVVQWLRFRTPNAVVCGLVSDQGARSHMLQLRVCMPELKILHATTMTRCSQIIKYVNKFFFFFF